MNNVNKLQGYGLMNNIESMKVKSLHQRDNPNNIANIKQNDTLAKPAFKLAISGIGQSTKNEAEGLRKVLESKAAQNNVLNKVNLYA